MKAIRQDIKHFRNDASGPVAGLVVTAPTGVFQPVAATANFIPQNGEMP